MYKTSLPIAAEIGYMIKRSNVSTGVPTGVPVQKKPFILSRLGSGIGKTLNTLTIPALGYSIVKDLLFSPEKNLAKAYESMNKYQMEALRRYNSRPAIK